MPEVKHIEDMSIAGKRARLNGSRSNLFYEAIRIIKEMREKTNGTKPRYTLWENVPGHSPQTKEKILKKYLKKSLKSKDIKLMCLDLTGGKMQDLSWQMIGQLGMGIKIQKVFMIVEVFCLCRISFRKVPV